MNENQLPRPVRRGPDFDSTQYRILDGWILCSWAFECRLGLFDGEGEPILSPLLAGWAVTALK